MRSPWSVEMTTLGPRDPPDHRGLRGSVIRSPPRRDRVVLRMCDAPRLRESRHDRDRHRDPLRVRLRRGLARHARAAGRQGREHRRDDARARRRPGARRLHDHHRGLRRVHARRAAPSRPGWPSRSPKASRASRSARAAALGDPDDPLLVSVRSGARDSMPGMLESILDLGLNDESVLGLAAHAGDEHFAWDSYRRFVQMFGNVVRGIPGERYEEVLARRPATRRRARGPRAARGRRARDHAPLPHALRGAHRRAVPAGSAGAAAPRRPRRVRLLAGRPRGVLPPHQPHPGRLGHGGQRPADGVRQPRRRLGDRRRVLARRADRRARAQRRLPARRAGRGRRLRRAHAAPARTSWPTQLPEAHAAAAARSCARSRPTTATCRTSSSPSSAVASTCCRRAAPSARRRPPIRFAVDAVDEGLLTREQALRTIDAGALDALLHPTFDPEARFEVLARGVAASPGAAKGEVVFTAEEAVAAAAQGARRHPRRARSPRPTTSPASTPRAGSSPPRAARPRTRRWSPAAWAARRSSAPASWRSICARARSASATWSSPPASGSPSTAAPAWSRATTCRWSSPARSERFERVLALGRRDPPARRARQRRHAGRRAEGARARRRGHRPVPHRAHVHGRRSPAEDARDDHGPHASPSGAPRWPSCCRCSSRTSRACSRRCRASRSRSACSTRRCTSSSPTASSSPSASSARATSARRSWRRSSRSSSSSCASARSTRCSARAAAGWASCTPRSTRCRSRRSCARRARRRSRRGWRS